MPTPKGMRDFPPEEMLLRKQVFSRLKSIFEKFGFDPFGTPVVELWETMKGKYGDEAENQMLYYFKDRLSGREMALRYDLTVPLARYMAENTNQPLPFCRYHIGRVYRHDRPQKGRYREFWQCDADVVGSDSPQADALIVNLILEVMKEFKFKQFTLNLNDRRLLKGIFEEGLGVKNLGQVYTVVDKINKIGPGEVQKELEKLEGNQKAGEIMEVLKIKGKPLEVLAEAAGKFKNPEVEAARADLEAILDLVDSRNIKLDLSMVRGLDYYTGPIFETVVEEPNVGSITGGGRYDGLIGRYGGRDLPATGTTIGVERLIDTGLELGLFQLDRQTNAEVGVVSMDQDKYAWQVARRLREAGLKVKVDLMGRNWGNQKDHYNKLGIPVMVFVGGKEVEAGTATVVCGDARKVVELKKAAETARSLLKA